jgi:putative acetyltransferase
MSRSLEIREEIDVDFDAVASLHNVAFGGGMESRIVSRIRKDHRPYLSYVALSDSRVCGHALFSEVDVIGTGTSAVAIALGPVAVLPARQMQGIGTELIRHGLKWCREVRYEACFVLGDPAYYTRFGFRQSFELGFWFGTRRDRPAFQILPFDQGPVDLPQGEVRYASVFYDEESVN